jgi:plasmid stabilization system protein ParE
VSSQFVVRPEAEADIDEAHEWYEGHSLGLGTRFLDAVEETLGWVRDSPQRFPVKHQEPDLTIRRALVPDFPYGVFFVWDEAADATSVIACMHARRDPRRWLERA